MHWDKDTSKNTNDDLFKGMFKPICETKMYCYFTMSSNYKANFNYEIIN